MRGEQNRKHKTNKVRKFVTEFLILCSQSRVLSCV